MKARNDSAAPDPAEEIPPIFSARLMPYRSLKPTGFALVMGLIAGLVFTVSGIFWTIGAWPVVGFLGLDVLLVYFAFRANFHAAKAYEIVEVTREVLTVRKVAPNGRAREFRFNPYWARLEIDRAAEEGITRIRIASHGRRLDIGRFLTPDDRDSFAAAFANALSQVRTAASA